MHFILNIYCLKHFLSNYAFYRLLTQVECSIIEKGYAAVILQLVARDTQRSISATTRTAYIIHRILQTKERTNEATK